MRNDRTFTVLTLITIAFFAGGLIALFKTPIFRTYGIWSIPLRRPEISLKTLSFFVGGIFFETLDLSHCLRKLGHFDG